MKFPIIIKQSPLVLIRRIIEIELSISVIVFLVSYAANYQQLYQESFIGQLFRYDFFLVVVVSLAQLIITLITFLTWHNEEYRVKEKEIIHRYGFIFSKEKSILLKNVTSIEYKRSPIEFLLSVGTISITSHNSPKPFFIRSIESAEIYSNIIKDTVDRALQRPTESLKKLSILDLILEGEHSRLEFKQTFRWDGRQKITSKPLEKAVIKTIAAFLNSDGGTLLIGVTDAGKIYGLDEDYNCLNRKDRDGFENHLNQIIKNMIGVEFRQYVTVAFEAIEDKDVCLVEVKGSPKPAYVKANGDSEEFFIRTGNTTSALSLSETHSYIDTHWEK